MADNLSPQRLLSISCLLLLLALSHVTSQDDFLDTKIDGLGSNSILHCTNFTSNKAYPNDSLPEAWMLPDFTILYNVTGGPGDRFRMEDNGWSLSISSVEASDIGLYHCMMKTPADEWFLVKLGLNAKGPYYEDLWEKYKLNTIIGLSAAGGFLLLVGLVYLAQRYLPPLPGACQDNEVDVAPHEMGGERNGPERGMNGELNEEVGVGRKKSGELGAGMDNRAFDTSENEKEKSSRQVSEIEMNSELNTSV